MRKFISHVEKNISEIEKFLGYVVASVADVEQRKVKVYLFHWRADLTFQGSTQVGFLIAYGRGEKCTAPCLV